MVYSRFLLMLQVIHVTEYEFIVYVKIKLLLWKITSPHCMYYADYFEV